MDDIYIEELIEDLKSGDAKVRWNVAYELGKVLESEDVEVRWNAAYELGKNGDVSAVPILVEALADEKSNVRSVAAWALSMVAHMHQNFDWTSALPALVKAFGDKDIDVKGSAALALGMIGDISVGPALVEAIGDEDEVVRVMAAEALAKIVMKADAIEKVEKIEVMLKQEHAALAKNTDRKVETLMEIAKLMKRVSERKNELASKRDMLLDDKPKPPERGRMYQTARRVRNGNL